MKSQSFLFFAACAVALLTAAPASGQPRPLDNRTQPRVLSPVAQAQKNVSEATLVYNKANLELKELVKRMRTEFEGTPAWTEAQAAVKATQVEEDKARKPVLDALKSSPAYAAALAAKAKAEAEHARAVGQSDVKPEERVRAINAVKDASKEVEKLESEAVAIDPKVMDVEAKVNDAEARNMALNAEFDKKLRDDPAWQAAKKAVDDAKEKLATEQKALAEAVKQQAANRLHR